MEKSESIKNLAAALLKFHATVPKVVKDGNNPFHKSKYATLDSTLETISKPLNDAGLTFVQMPVGQFGLTTILIHVESGEFIQSEYIIPTVKTDPQTCGSVITYQRRYALTSMLGLATAEDDDGNAATMQPVKAIAPVKSIVKNDKSWLNKDTDLFKKAADKLKQGETTIDKISAAYNLSKEVKEALLKFSKSSN